jgi:hypothetical protein
MRAAHVKRYFSPVFTHSYGLSRARLLALRHAFQRLTGERERPRQPAAGN